MRLISGVLLGVLMVVLAGAAAFGALFRAPESPVLRDVAVEPVLVSPSVASTSLVEPANLVLEWSPPESLLWPGASGLVTAVLVEPASVVENGSVLAFVDRVGVVAVQTSSPLHRDLSRGVRGADVLALAEALVDLGLLAVDDVGEIYSYRIGEAVKTLNESRHVVSSSFDVSHAVWLSAPFELAGVDLRVGAMAPSLGSESFVAAATLLEARVVTSDADSAGAGRPMSFDDGLVREVMVDGVSFPLRADGVMTDAQKLRGQVDVDVDVDVVEQVVVRLATPLVSVEVPTSAVLTFSDGGFCVIANSRDVVRVEVLGASAGRVQISDVQVDQVIVNPARAAVAMTCDG